MRECSVSTYLDERSTGEFPSGIPEISVVALRNSLAGVRAFSKIVVVGFTGGTMFNVGRCGGGSISWVGISALPTLDEAPWYDGLSNQCGDGGCASRAESASRRRPRRRKSKKPRMTTTIRQGMRIAKVKPTRDMCDDDAVMAETGEDGEGLVDIYCRVYVANDVGSVANVLAFEACDKLDEVEMGDAGA